MARRPHSITIIFLLFLICVAGAWAWFKVGIDSAATDNVKIVARPEVAGYAFVADELSEAVVSILSTTNIINGTFVPTLNGNNEADCESSGLKTDNIAPEPNSTSSPKAASKSQSLTDGHTADSCVRVFMANWEPDDGRGKTLVNHTPDICWVNSGWKPIHVGQPSKILIDFGAKRLPFEGRIFEAPNKSMELVIWCTLVNGRVLPESEKFGIHNNKAGRFYAALNLARTATSRLWERTKRRLPSRGEKQFIRFSIPLKNGEWQQGLVKLGSFAHKWLILRELYDG